MSGSAGQAAPDVEAPPAAPLPAEAEPRPAHMQLRFNPQELWDFTLTTADGVVLKVHKAILAQRSGFFASLFTDMRESSCLDLPETLEQLLPLLQAAYTDAPTPVPAGSSAAGDGAAGSGMGWAGDGLWLLTVHPANLRAALEVGRKYDCRKLLSDCDSLMALEVFKDVIMRFSTNRALSPVGAAPLGVPFPAAPPTAIPTAATLGLDLPTSDILAAACLTPFSCLALAQAYSLPQAGPFWRAQLLAHACQITEGWLQPGAPGGGRAAAVQQLAELRVEELAGLAADVLELAGGQARDMQGLRYQAAQADKERRKLDAFRRAVDVHVRDFPGAKKVRAAVKADVHAVG